MEIRTRNELAFHCILFGFFFKKYTHTHTHTHIYIHTYIWKVNIFTLHVLYIHILLEEYTHTKKIQQHSSPPPEGELGCWEDKVGKGTFQWHSFISFGISNHVQCMTWSRILKIKQKYRFLGPSLETLIHEARGAAWKSVFLTNSPGNTR